VLRGLAGNDLIFADGGNDRFIATLLASGDDGDDTYYGDGGLDTADYSALTRGIVVEMDFERGTARAEVQGRQAGEDELIAVENIVGTQAADRFIDSGGDNQWTGGGGSDTFEFNDRFGNDTITDFTVPGFQHDRLILDHDMFERYRTPADLLRSDHVAQVGSDVVIHAGSHNDLTLLNTSLVELRLHADVLFWG
jgi:Ca2+-binding RTX toxin-like protein